MTAALPVHAISIGKDRAEQNIAWGKGALPHII